MIDQKIIAALIRPTFDVCKTADSIEISERNTFENAVELFEVNKMSKFYSFSVHIYQQVVYHFSVDYEAVCQR